MTRFPRLILGTTLAVLTVVGAVAGAAPAYANLPIVAHGQVSITYTATTFTLCASGRVDDGVNIVGQWIFEVDGIRSDGTQIHTSIPVSGSTYNRPCYGIAKYGTANGVFVTTLSFVGAGTNPDTGVPDVIVVAGGVGSWDPNAANTIGF